MGFDLLVFFVAGIQESLSPVQLASAGMVALALLALRGAGRAALAGFAAVFLASALVLGAVFDLRLLDMVLLAPAFFRTALCFYGAMGIFFLIIAVAFFREWRRLLTESSLPVAGFVPRLAAGGAMARAMAFILAVVLVLFANAWPSSYQIIWQGGMAWTPGMFFYSVGSLMFFELCRNAGIILVLAVFFLARRAKAAEVLRGKRSLVAVVLSAVYLAAGAAMIFFAYMINDRLTVTLS